MHRPVTLRRSSPPSGICPPQMISARGTPQDGPGGALERQNADGLYLQSRYGVLRLCPVGSAIVRVTFVKGSQMTKASVRASP